MIGNDIVDLKLASIESNWKRKGFLNKVFTEAEQDLILNTNNSFKMVWLLWSMKESAYKVYVQQNEKRFFSPKKFQCILTSNTTGTVKIYDNQYNTESIINNNYIATTATLNYDDPVLVDNFHLKKSTYKFQHKNCYTKLKKEISNKMKFPFNEIIIRKNKVGVPRLFFKDKEQKTSFTISHHGNYGGYAILNY
jgi:phosphopantetheinyl transferase (holo-ACP synthase)